MTGEAGSYQFALPPGSYTVAFELTGFAPLRREGIIVQVARTARVDVELGVGTLQETVTVSGASPVVDVSSTVTQTNISKDLYENIPTGRNPWTMAGLVPGVVTGRLDVGGTEGAQQYNLEAFGSANSQKSFSIDGLKVNWAGGDGGATMMYYGFEMYDEYNMQTASGTAESDVSGVFMNMVTKSGGNRFASDNNFYFMNDALQGSNIDDDLRQRLGLQPGQETGAAGNPIDISYDWSSTLGGPIARDKAWFFGAIRWWRLDQFQIGASNPDGSQAIDDNRIRNFMGKGTWQATPTIRTSFLFNKNINDRFHRRDAPYLIVEDKATVLQNQPAQNYVVQYNHVVGRRMVLDARFGRMWGVFPVRYQAEVQPTDIAIRDVVRNSRINAAETQSLNPNGRYQGNFVASYFLDSKGAGTHDLKGGLQLSWERVEYERIRNGDILLELQDGRAVPGAALEHADQLRPSPEHVGVLRAGPLAGGARDHYRRPPRRRGERLSAGADQPGRHVRRGPQLSGNRRLRLRAEPGAAPRRLLRPVRERPHGPEGLLRALLQPVRVADLGSRQPQRDRQPGGVVERHQREHGARSR